jgi:hypothetical protein
VYQRRQPTQAEIAEMDEIVRERDDEVERVRNERLRDLLDDSFSASLWSCGREEFDDGEDIDARERAVDEILDADERNGIRR